MSPVLISMPVRLAEPLGSPLRWAGPSFLRQVAHGLGVVARLVGARRSGDAPVGSLPSFEAAALPHLDAVYNLARFLCRDPAAAEDIAQEAYLRAFRGWSEFRGGSVRAWLFAIVRNCCSSHREQERRNPARPEARHGEPENEGSGDPALLVAAEGDPELALLREDEDARVRDMLASLPDDAREILVLRDIEDCSYREIADVLGLPIGTVMSRLSRARRTFAARWNAASQESGS